MPSPSSYVRLKPSVLDHLTRNRLWPKQTAFTRHFREGLNLRGQTERQFARLRRGEAVPEAVVTALLDYLERKRGLTFDHPVAEPTLPPAAPPSPAGEGARWSMDRIGERLSRPFRDAAAMYLADPAAETRAVAEAFFRWLGDGDVRAGAAVRGLSVEAMAAWLLRLHGWDDHTVMYAVDRGRRVAAVAMLPTSEETFRRVVAGRLRPEEFPDPPAASRYVWIELLVPLGGSPVAGRNWAETRTMMVQLAHFTRGRPTGNPRPYTLSPSPVYVDRLRRRGYRPTGGTMKGTAFPILAVPDARDRQTPTERWEAGKLRLALALCREFNTAAWGPRR